MTNDYYPLLLRAIPQEKIWGGHNLEKFLGKSFATDALIGETAPVSLPSGKDSCTVATVAGPRFHKTVRACSSRLEGWMVRGMRGDTLLAIRRHEFRTSVKY